MKKYLIIKKKNDSKLITFNIGGSNVFKDQNKGCKHISELLNLSEKYIGKDYKFIFFGSKTYDNFFKLNKKIHINYFLNSKEVAKVFLNSNYTFVLSQIESFSLITAESLMCGCPVVCFDDNAASELIVHKKNGYLLKRKDKSSFLHFLKWASKNKNFFNRKKISEEANKKFSYKFISQEYMNVYEKL